MDRSVKSQAVETVLARSKLLWPPGVPEFPQTYACKCSKKMNILLFILIAWDRECVTQCKLHNLI